MKKIQNLIIVLLFTINCQSQEGNVVSRCNSSLDFPYGTYLKDINNQFQYYIGTWQGVYNNTTIELTIQFFENRKSENADGTYVYYDELGANYKVLQGLPDTAFNPPVLYSSMHITEFMKMPLLFIGCGRNNEAKFAYTDHERCNIEGDLKLVRNLSNPNELQYRFHISPAIIFPTADCPFPNGIVPVPLPSTVLTLTKIN